MMNPLDCEGKLLALYFNKGAVVKVLSDGRLYYEGLGAWKRKKNSFCVDHFLPAASGKVIPLIDAQKTFLPFVSGNFSSAEFSGFICSDVLDDYDITKPRESGNATAANEEKQTLLDCEGPTMNVLKSRFRIVYICGGCLSCVFLIATLYIYLRLKSLKNLHGKIVVFNVVSILLTTVLLVILFNVRPGHNKAWCKTVGYLTYYAGIAMFCWMSVMCFDLGWTFVRAKIPRKGSDHFKLFLYSVFAWGLPAILLAFVILIDTRTLHVGSRVLPDVGLDSCFLSVAALQRYFYPPISALLCFNAIMFFITIYALWKTKRFSRRAGIKRVSRSRASTVNKSNFSSVSIIFTQWAPICIRTLS